jgi:SAM-dependent methyltransferase
VSNISVFAKIYNKTYKKICGVLPSPFPWHFQWLATVYLNKSLKQELLLLTGKVLDVGCGSAPYRIWCSSTAEYIGLDVVDGPEVDVCVKEGEMWELDQSYFDSVMSTQVLEHVKDLQFTVDEIDRVLKPGGTVVLAFPFLYNEHGAPWDYRRFTKHYASSLFQNYKVERMECCGSIGSTIGLLVLNWIENTFSLNKSLRLLKGMLILIWICFSFVINLLSIIFDTLDVTDTNYNNIVVVLKKPI